MWGKLWRRMSMSRKSRDREGDSDTSMTEKNIPSSPDPEITKTSTATKMKSLCDDLNKISLTSENVVAADNTLDNETKARIVNGNESSNRENGQSEETRAVDAANANTIINSSSESEQIKQASADATNVTDSTNENEQLKEISADATNGNTVIESSNKENEQSEEISSDATSEKKGIDSSNLENGHGPSEEKEDDVKKSPSPVSEEEVDEEMEESSSQDEDNENNSDNLHSSTPETVPIDGDDGEIIERILGEYRVKLFRFEDHEWKERGIGDLKIMQSMSDPSNCRVAMWREGTRKVACNFRLYQGLKVANLQNNPKILTWGCLDYTQGEGVRETFSCRFANEEACTDFKTKANLYASQPPEVPDAVIRLVVNEESGPQSEVNENVDGGDAAGENAAEPPLPCSGCRGCNPTEFEFPSYTKTVEEPIICCKLSDDSSTEAQEIVLTPSMFDL